MSLIRAWIRDTSSASAAGPALTPPPPFEFAPSPGTAGLTPLLLARGPPLRRAGPPRLLARPRPGGAATGGPGARRARGGYGLVSALGGSGGVGLGCLVVGRLVAGELVAGRQHRRAAAARAVAAGAAARSGLGPAQL